MSDNASEKSGRDPVVIEPRPSRIDPPLHDTAVFCPVGPFITLAARLYGAKRHLRSIEPARAYSFKSAGKSVSLIGPAMGAPAAVYVLERLIANKVKNVVMVGLAGSTHSKVKIGDLVIPDRAWIEEGVSGHYEPGIRFAMASPRGFEIVHDAARSMGRTFHVGPVWTIDAVFRETKAKVMKYGQRGCLAVEMESSALFTVGAYRGIDVASILVVSDELFDLRWRMGFTRPRFLLAVRQAFRVARAAALKMAGVEEVPPEPPDREETELETRMDVEGETSPETGPEDDGGENSQA